MGASSSTIASDSYKQRKHYTNAEIENNIRRIFINSKTVDNTSIDSLKWNNLDNEVQEGGGLSISESSTNNELKDRYSKYDISNILPRIQDGGNIDEILNENQSDSIPNYNQVSDNSISEFDQIKKHMLDSMQSNNVEAEQERKPNIINLFGGSNFSIYDSENNKSNNESETSFNLMTENSKTNSSASFNSNDEDDDSEEVDICDEDDSECNESDKIHADKEFEESMDDAGFATSSNGSTTISISSYKSDTQQLSSTQEKSSVNSSTNVSSVSTYGKTSNNSDSINIRPFSSTDTADYTFRHPYSSNRFK